MITDRTVHALSPDGTTEIVRYDRGGKWYIEAQDRTRRRISIGEAVNEAVRLRRLGGTIRFRQPGGNQFDAKVKSVMERAL